MPRCRAWSSSSSAALPTRAGSGPSSGSRPPRSTYEAMTGEPGKFAFEPVTALPPMFQALPLQMSVAALVRRGQPPVRTRAGSRGMGPARVRPPDRPGRQCRPGRPDERGHQAPHDARRDPRRSRILPARPAWSSQDVVVAVRGMELAGLAERRTPSRGESILVLEDDPETGAADPAGARSRRDQSPAQDRPRPRGRPAPAQAACLRPRHPCPRPARSGGVLPHLQAAERRRARGSSASPTSTRRPSLRGLTPWDSTACSIGPCARPIWWRR